MDSPLEKTTTGINGEGLVAMSEEVVVASLILCVQMWLKGTLNVPLPPLAELGACIYYLVNLPHADFNNIQVQEMVKRLVDSGIGQHFNIVASHRTWIQHVYELCQIAKVPYLHVDLKSRIRKHDLSKYGPKEAPGYSIMFGKTGQFRSLNDTDKEQFEEAVANHYKANTHHPEHYGNFPEMLPMCSTDLQESLMDMVACHLERTLKDEEALTADMIMDISHVYLNRYHPGDRIIVQAMIKVWVNSLHLAIKYPNEKQQKSFKQWTFETGKILLDNGKSLPF